MIIFFCNNNLNLFSTEMADQHTIKNFGKTIGNKIVVGNLTTTAVATSSISSTTAALGSAQITGGIGVFGHSVPSTKTAVAAIPSPGSAVLGDAVAKVNELIGVLQGYGLI